MSVTNQPIVLVTGATGKIGGSLVKELQAQPGDSKIRIRAAARTQEKVEAFQKEGIDAVLFDCDRPETLPTALYGVDTIFLLTGYTVDMLAQSKAVIDAAKNVGVKHIVHLGAWATDDTTIVHLGWHQLVERYIEWSGMNYTHLRPNWFMQNVPLSSRESIKNESGTIYGYIGDARASWIDTDDIALAAAAVLRSPAEHAGKTYPLAVEALSLAEVAEVLTEAIGKPFRYVPRPPEDVLPALLSGGMEQKYAECIVNVMRRTGNGTLTEAADVFDNFEALIGKQPTNWKDFAAKHRALFEY